MNTRFQILDLKSQGVFGTFLLMWAASVQAATNEIADPDRIPPLRGPKPEIPPGFWEQHGLLTVLATIAVIIVVALLWRVLSRSKPPVVPAAAVVARKTLEPLQHRSEDAALLATVSAALRKYFIAAFVLPHDEFTNNELSHQLKRHPKVDSELAASATDLLQGMESCRFNADANASKLRAVEIALQLIDQAETILNPPPTDTAPATPQA